MIKVSADIVKRNGLVLSNAVAVASAIVTAIGEKDISKSINNESLTRDRIEHLVAARMTSTIISNA